MKGDGTSTSSSSNNNHKSDIDNTTGNPAPQRLRKFATVNRKPVPAKSEESLAETAKRSISNVMGGGGSGFLSKMHNIGNSNENISRHRELSQSSSTISSHSHSDSVSAKSIRSFRSVPPPSQTPNLLSIVQQMNDVKLNEMVEHMLNQMGVDETKRSAIRLVPKETKQKMVHQHLSQMSAPTEKNSQPSMLQTVSIGRVEPRTGADYYVKQLKQYVASRTQMSTTGLFGNNAAMVAKFLVSLKVSLQSQPITWIRQFVDMGGIDRFLDLFDATLNTTKASGLLSLGKKDADYAVELELVKCLKTMMNTKIGLEEVMKRNPRSVQSMTACIDSDNFFVRKYVMELLTVVCYTDMPHGHGQVMLALNNYSNAKKESQLHQTWISLFANVVDTKDKVGGDSMIAGVGWVGDIKATDKDVMEYYISNMMLVNAIVSTPPDIEYRIHLRNQFYAVGFTRVKQQLEKFAHASEYLKRQMDQFEHAAVFDWQEFLSYAEDIRVDERDPQRIFKTLSRNFDNKLARGPFLSILQTLLLIRNDPKIQKGYLQLIDVVTKQVVLDGKGIDPDFTKLFHVDVSEIVEQFTEKGELENSNAEIARLKQDILKLEEERASATLLANSATGTSLASMESMKSFEELLMGNIEISLEKHHNDLGSLLDALNNAALSSGDKSKLQALQVAPEMVARIEELTKENATLRVQATSGGLHIAERAVPASAKLTDASDLNSPEEEEVKIQDSEKISAPAAVPPPPPPAPMMLKKKPAKKLYYKARSKLKPLQWEKVPDHEIDETMWKQVCNEASYAKILENAGLFEVLESEFASAVVTSKAASNADNADTKASSSNVVNEVCVIDRKKAYNLMIMLSRIKYDQKDFMDAILRMDTTSASIVPLQTIKQLISFSPSPEEISALSPFVDTPSEHLAKPDMFLLNLISVNHYDLRLRYMQFKHEFEEQWRDVQAQATNIDSITHSIKGSKSLRQFLEIVLTIGNIMNGDGGFRGGAYGFRPTTSLRAITELRPQAGNRCDVKTLLHFILSLAQTHFGESTEFIESLLLVFNKTGARVSPTVVQQEFTQLYDEVTHLHRDFTKSSATFILIGQESPLVSLTTLLDVMTQHAAKLTKVMADCDDLVKWFGEDVSQIGWEDLTRDICTFVHSCRRVQKEIKDAAEKPIAKVKPVVAMSKNPHVSSEAPKEDQGVMDTLLESLRKGTPVNKDRGSNNSSTDLRRKPRRISMTQYSAQATQLLSQLESI